MIKNERGVAAVEFGLILLPFMLLLMGVMDYGYYFMVELAASNAAREAARTASTFPGACPNDAAKSQGTAVAYDRMTGVDQVANTVATITCSPSADGQPEFKAEVKVLFDSLTGFTDIVMPKEGAKVRAFASSTQRGID